MITLLNALHILTAIALIVVVLLQSGKSAGLSGAITGGAEQVFGQQSRGIDDLLSKITTGLAIAFFVISLLIDVLTLSG